MISKTRTITLNNAGFEREISVFCKIDNNLTTNASQKYIIYEYSRDEACSCASYKCNGSFVVIIIALGVLILITHLKQEHVLEQLVGY